MIRPRKTEYQYAVLRTREEEECVRMYQTSTLLALLLSGIILPATGLVAEEAGKSQASETNDCVTVICEPGIRFILDGVFVGIAHSRTNIVALRSNTNTAHRIILQKPDRVDSAMGMHKLYSCVPQSFTFPVESVQRKEIVAAPFTEMYMNRPQKRSPQDKGQPDCGYGEIILSSNPETCTAEFREEIIPLPARISDVCEGQYLLVVHHQDQTLGTNLTFRPHQSRSVKVDFVESCIHDLNAEREQRHHETRALIRKMRANGYADFPSLGEEQKDMVVWILHEDKEWGQPDQKVICRDLLANQGYSYANATAWTHDALDLAKTQDWKDSRPLILGIYEHPRNIWNYEATFLFLRNEAGRSVSTNLIADVQTVSMAGRYESKVTEAELSAAKKRLIADSDKEAVLVYCIYVACSFPGKGGTDRGRKGAIDILRNLDREVVVQRIQQFLKDCQDFGLNEFKHLARELDVDLKADKMETR